MCTIFVFLHPRNSRIYKKNIFTIHSVKENVSACGRSAQSRVKKIAQCNALALYQQEEHSQGDLLKSCQKQLIVTDRGGGDYDSVMFFLGSGAGFTAAGNR